MTITQYILTTIIGVTAVMLAKETHITSTDAGRLVLVVAITMLIVSVPASLPITMRLLSACIAGYALHRMLCSALGPVPFTVLSRSPAMLVASHSAYRMQFGVRRMVMA